MGNSKKNVITHTENISKKSGTTRIHVDSLVRHKQTIQKEIRTSKIKDTSTKGEPVVASSVDDSKRMFLKAAGVAGLGIAATALFPRQADAYVAGSTPTSNVVGLKDAANVRINPAKEDGNLATIAGKDFATQTTLALIKTNSDKFNFDGQNLKVTSAGAISGTVGVQDTSNTQVNPATEDSLILLRRILKQVDSLGVVDSAQRQKVTVEGATITSGTITTVGTVTTVTGVTSATNLVALGGVDGRYLHIDTARNASANGIRANLVFS
jgi:hypothetical protein